MNDSILLRLAGAEDEEFLYRVYYSTREEELAQTDWTLEQKEAFVRQQFRAQTHHYQTHYPGALFQVIEVEGREMESAATKTSNKQTSSPQPSPPSEGREGEEKSARQVGRLFVHHRPAEIRIMDIALLPEFRGRGIGTFLLREMQERGRREGKTVTIHVEVFNPALQLYERLGFKQMARTDVYWLMEWKPNLTTNGH